MSKINRLKFVRIERMFNPNKRTYLPMRYIAFKDPSNLRWADDRSSVNINDIIDWKRRSPSANAQRWESWTSSRTSISKECTAHAVLPLFSASGYAPLEELVIRKSNPSWEPQSTGQLVWPGYILVYIDMFVSLHQRQYTQQSTSRMVWNPTKPRNQHNNQPDSNSTREIELRSNWKINKMKSSSFKDGVGTRDPRRLLATDTEPHIEKKPATIAWGRDDQRNESNANENCEQWLSVCEKYNNQTDICKAGNISCRISNIWSNWKRVLCAAIPNAEQNS